MSRPSAPLFVVALCALLAQPAAAEKVPSYKTAPLDEAKPAATAPATTTTTSADADDEPTVDAKNQVSEGEFSLDDETAAEGDAGADDDEDELADDGEEDSFDDEVAEVDPTSALAGTPSDAELAALADEFVVDSAKVAGAEGALPEAVEDVSSASATTSATTTTSDGVSEDVSARNVMDPETSLAATPRTVFASTPNPEAHAAPNPKREVVEVQQPGQGAAPALTVTETPKPPKLAKAAVSAMQSALAKAGVAVDVDGVMGKDTRTALSAFQKKNGLAVTGQADVATLEKLGVAY